MTDPNTSWQVLDIEPFKLSKIVLIIPELEGDQIFLQVFPMLAMTHAYNMATWIFISDLHEK